MSSSPPKKGEAEEGEQSPQEHTEQGTGQGPMDPLDTQGQGTEVEVKEQDRWLPIANGRFSSTPLHFLICARLFPLHVFSDAVTGVASLLQPRLL